MKFILLVFCTNVAFVSFAQKKEVKENQTTTTPVAQNAFSTHEKVYRSALKYGDLSSAKNALFYMMAEKPEATELKDTLAILYYNMGSFAECLLVTRENLEKKPENLPFLELKAICEQNLGLIKDALGSYESLFSKSKDPYHLYQIGTLQYELKRFGECKLSADQILANKEADKKEISISAGRNQQQKVSLKAAALNLKGVLLMEVNDIANAKPLFEEALKLNPEFVLAKGNIALIESKTAKPADKLAPSKSTTKTKTN